MTNRNNLEIRVNIKINQFHVQNEFRSVLNERGKSKSGKIN